MKASLLLLGALSAAVVASASGCSSEASDDDGAAGGAAVSGSGGSAGSGAAGKGGGAGTGVAGKGGAAGQGGTTGQGGTAGGGGGSSGDAGAPSSTGGSAGEAGATNTAGAGNAEGGGAGATGAELVGVCAHRADGTVTVDDFTGFEEYVLIGDEGFGDELCVVRFDVTRAGAAPEGCSDCLWTHLVELSNPTVVLDENGVCARSELGLDEARIAELDGSRIAYGFIPEYEGHASIAMTYIEASETWEPYNVATWDEGTGRFRFDRRNGTCGY